ncbi:MAG TPA: sigma 54-interacting transcriptional regulator [Myxococcota bacterium]|nr:sigma 54-interacting transcriptional regulator [Myxococcota bacterium]HRY95627.1 sigma 54-interacting transcriptional regulator [Myxococcota bacterium]HSA20348.1 sigma 54-interacting transcriptional regulator [Myxococcota bacterium]
MSEPAPSADPRGRHSLFWRFLGAFLLVSVLPLAGVQVLVGLQLEGIREAVDQGSRAYELKAERLAGRVAAFLRACEADLRALAALPRSDEAYQRFARERTREVWVRSGTDDNPREERGTSPLYREVAFADATGQEQVLIARGRPMGPAQRRLVSDPAQTTYRSETYFQDALDQPPGEIWVSHLTGFQLTKVQQLGLERLLAQMKGKDPQTRAMYRYLLYELLRAGGALEYSSSFQEKDRTMLVYRVPGEDSRVLVEEPQGVTPAQIQARELELKEFIKRLEPEDVVEGERYDGVIRFALAVRGPDGKPEGVVSLALDHVHLMQLTQHFKAMEEDVTVFAGYRDADYTYLFDDEGWIITHPKQYEIRGLDHLGQPVPPYTPRSLKAEVLIGRTPVNLLELDWKMGEGYHALVLETRAGRTGIATSNNLGGVLRTRVYSPIFYDRGVYKKYGIFGGVMMGTRVDKFIEVLRQINGAIGTRTLQARRATLGPMLAVLVLVLLLSVALARSLVRPIRALGEVAQRIGAGELATPIPATERTDELGELAQAFGGMTRSLQATIQELEARAGELKQAQQKLLESERDKQRALERELAELQQEVARATFANMLGDSPGMRRVREEIVRVAPSTATVLVLGENGTGKELVAEAIHRNSPRRDRRFLKVNCAAFNDNLLESELFGHMKGAYTGASASRKGLFEMADGGTLLLDEVGDMSLEMQKKLLRTLQEGEIVPVGSTRVLRVDVRLLAATNRDLAQRMREGAFREDLYHRLNVIQIRVPPLRERREDIPLLARFFIQKYADKEGRTPPLLDAEAERFLLEYAWPGNVRELENAMERAVIRAIGAVLRVADFQLEAGESAGPGAGELDKALAEELSLDQLEQRYIERVLTRCGGNKRAAARLLGIGYNTLWRKLKKMKGEGSSDPPEME